MNISSTIVQPRSTQQCHNQRPDHKEGWSVRTDQGRETFKTTADLVAASDKFDGTASAKYYYQEAARMEEGSTLKSIALSAAGGAAIGAAVGAAAGVGLNIVGQVFFFMSAGFYGQPASMIGGAAAIGAGLGAFMGPASHLGSISDYKRAGLAVPGTLVKDDDQLHFHPYNSLEEKIDLHKYKDAPVHDSKEKSDCTPWWKNKGLSPL